MDPDSTTRRVVELKQARHQQGSVRLAESLADNLRQRIFEGQFGSLMPRLEVLVSDYDVSAPSMREALRVLETEGLITVRRGNSGGAVIHPPTERHVARAVAMVLQSDRVPLRDVAQTMEDLEALCARHCARRGDRAKTVVPVLRENCRQANQVVDDLVEFGRLGNAFHVSLATLCGNATLRLLSGAMESLWTAHTEGWHTRNVREGRPPPRHVAQAALRAHEQITDRIEAGDERAASGLIHRHFDPKQFSNDPAALDQTVDSEFIKELFNFEA